MRFFTTIAALAVLLLPLSSAAAEEEKPPEKPCAIHSTSTGSIYDLAPLRLFPRDDDDVKSTKGTNESYHSRGYDYHRNFTLNICGPVVEELHDVAGISKSLYANISAFYKDPSGDVFSIGQLNQVPMFRGRKLLLNYTHGSPCPDLDEHGDPIVALGHDDMDKKDTNSSSKRAAPQKLERRKSTLLSFICDTAPGLATRPQISFIGSPDHCAYIFEVRSRWACPGATPVTEKGELGPGGVFAVILGIAIAVYIIGGVVYQRNVMHQRGWRQIPNYSVWAGLLGFFRDMSIILFSSCTRHLPSVGRMFGGHRGHHRIGDDDALANGSARRGRTSEDANRLIDSLDEEWD